MVDRRVHQLAVLAVPVHYGADRGSARVAHDQITLPMAYSLAQVCRFGTVVEEPNERYRVPRSISASRSGGSPPRAARHRYPISRSRPDDKPRPCRPGIGSTSSTHPRPAVAACLDVPFPCPFSHGRSVATRPRTQLPCAHDEASPGGHCGACQESQRDRLTPARRHLGSATSGPAIPTLQPKPLRKSPRRRTPQPAG